MIIRNITELASIKNETNSNQTSETDTYLRNWFNEGAKKLKELTKDICGTRLYSQIAHRSLIYLKKAKQKLS